MAFAFPLYVDLKDNNCVVFGGNEYAASCVERLMHFGAKVTVVHPTLCDKLKDMDKKKQIRYIPRRYFRGDCRTAYLCIAATEDEKVNIAISDECKAKGLSVNVESPSVYGTFLFPEVVIEDQVEVVVTSSQEKEELVQALTTVLKHEWPSLLKKAEKRLHQKND